MPLGNLTAVAVDVRAGVPEHFQRRGIAAEVDPDLLEDRVRVLLERREALFVQNLVRLQLAGEERQALGLERGSGSLPGRTTATGSMARGLVSGHSRPSELLVIC